MERVDLSSVHSACRAWWTDGETWDWDATRVLVGEVTDGRWYVRLIGRKPKAIAYGGPHAEWLARRTARCWMRMLGGEWVGA